MFTKCFFIAIITKISWQYIAGRYLAQKNYPGTKNNVNNVGSEDD